MTTTSIIERFNNDELSFSFTLERDGVQTAAAGPLTLGELALLTVHLMQKARGDQTFMNAVRDIEGNLRTPAITTN